MRIGFMRRISVSTVILSACIAVLSFWGEPRKVQSSTVTQVTEHLTVVSGALNGAFIERRGKTLVIYGDPRQSPIRADKVLLTHHRRDAVWAARALVKSGAKTVGPQAEAELFMEADTYWSGFAKARFHDYRNQTTKVLAGSLPLDRSVAEGSTIDWEDLAIQVMDTPGYTPGAVSYLAEIDHKTVVFTGDLIYGDGKIFDWYSLQDSVPELRIDGYHGYGARSAQLIRSLERIRAKKPDFLVPLRGPIIRDVDEAISKLISRIRRVYANYLSVSAYRWYIGQDRMEKLARLTLGSAAEVPWMPMAAAIREQPPPWIIPIRNSRLVLARDGSGFLIDCGPARVIEELERLRDSGLLKTLDGCFITHYHDDHTNRVGTLVKEFGCPVYASEELRDILERPEAYRLPCLTENAVPNLRAMKDGSTLRWKEFEFTFYYFPGQTIFHDALLVSRDDGERLLFTGDSFTPTGMDDYCPLNRNFLHRGMGYQYCLDMLKRIPGKDYWLVNQHVVPVFRYSERQIDLMAQALAERRAIYDELFPWDDPNYGLDEGWVRFYPYAQSIHDATSVELALKIFNHSPSKQRAQVRLNLPSGWTSSTGDADFLIAPRQEGLTRFKIRPPVEVQPGIYLVTADLRYGSWDLREWTEAMIFIE